jgi:3-oxoacyl-[acyl-carrier-protein] synthase II
MGERQSKTEVVVTGIGLISALGNLTESWTRLLSAQTGIERLQPFPELSPRPLGTIGTQLSEFLPLTRKVVEAALDDAGLTSPLPDCGVVIGSSRSQQGRWERSRRAWMQGENDGEVLADWLQMLPHTGAIAAAGQIGSKGAVLAPMAACATGIWAIAQGFELIQTGRCQRAIAGAVEVPITPLTLAGFEKMGALATTGAYPFDRCREGLVLGEGAAVLVLESAELARSRGASSYGRVLGFGLSADGHHVSAPDPNGQGAMASVKQCLDRSGLTPTDIDYIHAHGTATLLNDRNEARLIRHLFPHGVALSSTKGATGHAVGASGALGAAFGLMALKDGILPPCVGLSEPEFELDLVQQARSSRVDNVLCFSFGFGGQNAAIALGRE